jgi:ankyrin repeat protein
MIALLVRHGADLDCGDAGGVTPLHRAVRARGVAAVRQLLACGARVDCCLRKSGSSPLHMAAHASGAGGTAGASDAQMAIIELLLRHGADTRARDAAGRTAAATARNATIAAMLRARRR